MTNADEIIGACIAGDTDRVATLLEADPKRVAARDPVIDSTPLHFASHRGFEPIVALLLARGADVDAREGASGTLALHWAAEGGHADVARRLLDAGSRLDVRDGWHDLEPLGWAAVVDHAPAFRDDRSAVATLLLSRGAPLDAFTALWRHDAAGARRLPPEAWRRRLGTASRGQTPLHTAAARGDAVAIDLGLDCGAPIDWLDDWGASARGVALAAGHADAAARLAQRGARLDLSAALATGDLQAATRHAAVDLRDGAAARLVHFTVRHAGAEATRWLLDRGADPDVLAVELRGDSLFRLAPLHAAAARCDVETARVLLDRGADPDRAAIGGTAHTPLHAAAAADAAEVAALLLARGADRGRRDAHHDATALEWARFFGHAQVAAAIEDAP